MVSRLVETVDGIVAELLHGGNGLPPALVELIRKTLRTTPPSDESVAQTFATIRSHLDYIETGTRPGLPIDDAMDLTDPHQD